MSEFFEDLINIILFLPRFIYKNVVDALVFMLNSVQPPFTSQDVTTALNGVGGDVLYFLTMFEFQYGLTVIFTAYLARFILRRIPGIG